MSVITTIRGGAVLTPVSLDYLRCRQVWPLDPAGPDGPWPGDAPRLAGAETTPAGPIRHFPQSRRIADCVAAALADAGLTQDDIAGPQTGFVSGSCYGCTEFLDSIRASLAGQGPRGVRATEFSIATHGYPIAALAMAYGAQGPATAFVGSGHAAVEALLFAELMLALGLCTRMIVVGYELPGRIAQAHLARMRGIAAPSCIVALVVESSHSARDTVSGPITTLVLPAGALPSTSGAAEVPAMGAAPLLDVFAQLRAQGVPAAIQIETAGAGGVRTRLGVPRSPGRSRPPGPALPAVSRTESWELEP